MAGTQTTTLSTSVYTDLGAAPLQLQTSSSTISVVIADSLPSLPFIGTILMAGIIQNFYQADNSSHVYAIGLQPFARVNYTPILG